MALRIVTSKTRLLQQRLPRGYPLRLNENHEHARGLIYTVPLESGQPWTIPGEADFAPAAGRVENQCRALRYLTSGRWSMTAAPSGALGMKVTSGFTTLKFSGDNVVPLVGSGLTALSMSAWFTPTAGANNPGIMRGGNDFFIFDSAIGGGVSAPWIRWGGTDLKAGSAISMFTFGETAHVCFTGENGGRFGVYRDGEEEWTTTSAATLALSTNCSVFGQNNGSERVDGWYHEIRLYNRHVSFEEHREHQLNRAALYRQRARVFPAAAGGGTDITVTDTSAGSDAIAAIAAAMSVPESATAADDVSGLAAALALTDTVSGADAIASVAVALSVTDAGAGADDLAAFILQAITDTASASDAIAGVTASAALADTASASDTLTAAVSLAVADTASAVDVVSVLAAVLKSVADAAAGSDAVGAVQVQVQLTEAAAASDLVAAIAAAVPVTDSASGLDVAARFDDATRIATLTLTFSPRRMAATFAPRTLTFTFN